MIDDAPTELDDILLWLSGQGRMERVPQALTAIYEIGLKVIGEDEEVSVRELSRTRSFEDAMSLSEEYQSQNSLRAFQRKAWAKACGVAEK